MQHLHGACVLALLWGEVEKEENAYRSPYRQLPGHLTGSLTGVLAGRELVGTKLW